MSIQNECVICLDPLAEKEFGTCDCGHCLHVECFNSLAASRLGQSIIKCPTCKKQVATFFRLFLDLGAAELAGKDDDDSLSLSSEESSFDENVDPEEGNGASPKPGDEQEALQKTCAFDGENSDEVEVQDDKSIIVIDSDLPMEKKKATKGRKRQSNGQDALSSDDARYKKKAKQYKKQVSMLESQRKQQSDEQRKLIEKLRNMQKELANAAVELEVTSDVYNTCQRKVEGLSLRVITLKRERDEYAKQLEDAERRATKSKRELLSIEERYKQKLEQQSTHAMNEVQQLWVERPKLVNENKDLKEQVRKLEQQVSALTGEMEPSNASDLAQNRTKKKGHGSRDNARQLLREISMTEEHYKQSSKQRARKLKDDGGEAPENEKSKKKMSAQAVRMSLAASRKPLARKVSGIDALNAADSRKSTVEPGLASIRLTKKAPNSRSMFASSSQTKGMPIVAAGQRQKSTSTTKMFFSKKS